MKNSDRKRIHRMEIEDDLGIKRTKKKKFVLPIKVYKIIKLCLIISIPVVYFLCSPLLILVMLAYIGLLVVTHSIEKEYNKGLKKDMRTVLPKTDSILCILVVIIAVTCVCVSSFSTTQRVSPFEGMTQEQIEETIDLPKFDKGDMTLRRVENALKNVATLSTGTRYLFQSERTFGRGRGPGGGMPDFEPPEGFTPPSGMPEGMGKPPDMTEMLENMPFSMVFESIIKAVNTGMIVIVCIVGLASLRKLKKLDVVY